MVDLLVVDPVTEEKKKKKKKKKIYDAFEIFLQVRFRSSHVID